MTKIPVVGDERQLMIDARLSDQNICEFCLVAGAKDTGTKQTGARPVTIEDLQHRQRADILRKLDGNGGIAQRLTNDDRRQ